MAPDELVKSFVLALVLEDDSCGLVQSPTGIPGTTKGKNPG